MARLWLCFAPTYAAVCGCVYAAAYPQLVYGWKLMDPDDVEGSIQPKGVKELPEMDEDTGTGFDALKDMADNFKTMQESLFGKK